MAVNLRAARRRGTERLRMTVEEYLAFEEMSQEKHEYVDGWVYPLFPEIDGMAGGTNNHAALTSNIGRLLGNALDDSPCIVYSPDARVQIDATNYRYPDVAVSCDPRDLEAGDEKRIHHPRVLVEVLSDGTEDVDRIDKLAEYRALPSVRDYLLVNYAARLIEHYHRAGELWTYRTYGPGETIALEGLGVALTVDRIYAKVRLPGDASSGQL
ncbi:MAG: Uma2 family endonuclease [Chloroflexota bacterium]|nr:Uma2 family endonuclease [Chloroflexota bacterium]